MFPFGHLSHSHILIFLTYCSTHNCWAVNLNHAFLAVIWDISNSAGYYIAYWIHTCEGEQNRVDISYFEDLLGTQKSRWALCWGEFQPSAIYSIFSWLHSVWPIEIKEHHLKRFYPSGKSNWTKKNELSDSDSEHSLSQFPAIQLRKTFRTLYVGGIKSSFWLNVLSKQSIQVQGVWKLESIFSCWLIK